MGEIDESAELLNSNPKWRETTPTVWNGVKRRDNFIELSRPCNLLFLSGEGAFAKPGQTQFPFHRLAVGGSGVRDSAFDLSADFE